MKTITTKRLILRPYRIDDAPRIEKLVSEKDIAKSTLNIPHPYPENSAKDFVTFALDMEKQGKMLSFAIIEKDENVLIGSVSFNLKKDFDRGELGYWIGKPYWNKGYGSEAAKALIRYGFGTLGLNRIYAAAFEQNPGSWRLMEKIGLKYEGTLREHVQRDGIHHDLRYYGLLRKDYHDNQSS